MKYNKVRNKAGVTFRPEIVAKWSDPRINRHQQLSCKGREQTQTFS